MRKTTICYPLFLLILLFLSSCSLFGNRLKDRLGIPDSKRVSEAKKDEGRASEPAIKGDKGLTKKQASERILTVKEEIIRHLDEGEFLAALEEIRQEVARGTSEKDLAPEYLLALNGTIALGQSRLKEDNPGQAGLLFRAGLDSFPKDIELAAKVDLPPPELEAKIELCADKLMEKGLVAYRVGNLNDAIEVWKTALAFQPRHQAILNAIQTAYTQLKNLKSITADK